MFSSVFVLLFLNDDSEALLHATRDLFVADKAAISKTPVITKKSSPIQRGIMPKPHRRTPALVSSGSKKVNAFKTRSSTNSSTSSILATSGESSFKKRRTNTEENMDAASLEVLNQDVTIEHRDYNSSCRISHMSPFYQERMLNRSSVLSHQDLNKSKARKFSTGIGIEEEGEVKAEFNKYIHKDDFKRMEVLGQFNLGFIIARLEEDLFIIGMR